MRQAWPRQGSELIARAGPRQHAGSADNGLYGELGKKYANDTFYGSKHIQNHAFLSPRVGQDGIRSAFNDSLMECEIGAVVDWARAGKELM